jgi:hypothetical protein
MNIENVTLRLTVTSDSGGTVMPTLTYDCTCSCGTKMRISRISGFGLPEGCPKSLLIDTKEVLTDECVCGKTNRYFTEINVVPAQKVQKIDSAQPLALEALK